MTGRWVAMEENRPRGFQEAAHFQQPHGHETHIGPHAIAMRVSCGFDSLHQFRVVVRYLIYPVLMHILFPRPPILKLGSGGEGIRRGVEVPSLVERRVGGDEVYGLAVHGPHEG